MAFRISKKVAIVMGIVGFVILAGVGGYVAWRLSQPKEVTPEETEAYVEDLEAYWDWCFWAGWRGDDQSDYKNWVGRVKEGERKNPDLYSIYHDLDSPAPAKGSWKDYFKIDGACDKAGAGATYSGYKVPCARLQKDQGYDTAFGGGATHPQHDDKPDLTKCSYCETLTDTEWNGSNLTVSAKGINQYPYIEYDGNSCSAGVTNTGDGCAHISLPGNSALKFRFVLTAPGGVNIEQIVTGDCTINENVGKWTYPDDPNVPEDTSVPELDVVITDDRIEWPILGHDPLAKELSCTAEHTFENLENYDEVTVAVSVQNPSIAQTSWNPADECRDTLQVPSEPICGDGILGNTPGEECEVGDPSGVTCSWSECDHSTCECMEPPPPNWEIEKNGEVVCYEEGTENVYAEATYSISIRNTGEGSTGKIEYVEDTPDPLVVVPDWVTSSDPTADLTGGTIRWNLTGTAQEFPYCADDTCWREFGYVVRIPRSAFGNQLDNQVIAQIIEPVAGTIQASEDIWVDCEGPEPPPPSPPELPGTGLFDSTGARIVVGSSLVIFGIVCYKFGFFDKPILWLTDGVKDLWMTYGPSVGEKDKEKKWVWRVTKAASEARRKSRRK